jgi:hypothetical protein
MPELEFTLDPTSGALQVHIRGIAGPACEQVAELARELLGPPRREERTAEYHVRPEVRPRVRPQTP